MDKISDKKCRKETIKTIVIFLIPIWLPILYLASLTIEVKYTKSGPPNAIGYYAFWLTPIFGSYPIFNAKDIHFLIKIPIIITYYVFGLFAAGIIGWGVGCSLRVIGCH